MKNKFKKLLLIDLDGVLNEYDGNFNKDEIPKIKHGAKNFLETLSTEYEIKIFTTRNKHLTQKWIKEHNLSEYIKGITNIKESAFLHIDDRCICFKGDYDLSLKQIQEFKVHWKK